MREEARAAVVAALAANSDLAGIQVELCWPGDQQKPESIWLNPTEGVDVTIPVFHGTPSTVNPVTIDDIFSIPVEMIVQNPGATPAEAEARLGTLRRAVIATLTADPGLSLVSAPSGWRIIAAEVASLDGPGTARGREGADSYASVVVHVHARKN